MQRSFSPDSLFDEDNDDPPVATRTCPPIPGLYIFPDLLPPDIASKFQHLHLQTQVSKSQCYFFFTLGQTLCDIAKEDIFAGGTRDQVMLFEAPNNDTSDSSLPGYIHRLLSTLSSLLSSDTHTLPPHLHHLLFSQPLSRQAIINLYPAGTGITPHIDLVGRYADGVVGCSVIGGCVMTFSKASQSQSQNQSQSEENQEQGRHDVYLPPRSVYILSGPARWDWTHGIEARSEDVVERKPRHGPRPKCEFEKQEMEMETETILRDLRLSITFRWLRPGANVLS